MERSLIRTQNSVYLLEGEHPHRVRIRRVMEINNSELAPAVGETREGYLAWTPVVGQCILIRTDKGPKQYFLTSIVEAIDEQNA